MSKVLPKLKYIKHMTSSGDDEKHQALMDKAGLKAYGAYWIIAERIAAQIRPECVSTVMSLSWRRWGLQLGIDQRSAQHILRCMNDVGLISLVSNNDVATVNMPNLLKYGDEYTKRIGINSRATPDLLALPALLKEHKPKVVRKRTSVAYSDEYHKFWSVYPRSIGKQLAYEKFQSVTKEYPPQDVTKAAAEYASKCENEHTEERYILHPATFLNKGRWKDYCFE